MIGIDWSHTKELTLYDSDDETTKTVTVKDLHLYLNGKQAVIEENAPFPLKDILLKYAPDQAYTIGMQITAKYRRELGLKKTDETDARLIALAATEGEGLRKLTEDPFVRLRALYGAQRNCMKMSTKIINAEKATKRYYGHLAGDIVQAFEETSDAERKSYRRLRNSYLKEIKASVPEPPASLKETRGFGEIIWAGIICAANPANSPSAVAYLNYLGYTEQSRESHKYSRTGKDVYIQFVNSIIKQRTPGWYDFYIDTKARLAQECPEWTKGKVDGKAKNRLATQLAKFVYRVVKLEE